MKAPPTDEDNLVEAQTEQTPGHTWPSAGFSGWGTYCPTWGGPWPPQVAVCCREEAGMASSGQPRMLPHPDGETCQLQRHTRGSPAHLGGSRTLRGLHTWRGSCTLGGVGPTCLGESHTLEGIPHTRGSTHSGVSPTHLREFCTLRGVLYTWGGGSCMLRGVPHT